MVRGETAKNIMADKNTATIVLLIAIILLSYIMMMNSQHLQIHIIPHENMLCKVII